MVSELLWIFPWIISLCSSNSQIFLNTFGINAVFWLLYSLLPSLIAFSHCVSAAVLNIFFFSTVMAALIVNSILQIFHCTMQRSEHYLMSASHFYFENLLYHLRLDMANFATKPCATNSSAMICKPSVTKLGKNYMRYFCIIILNFLLCSLIL